MTKAISIDLRRRVIESHTSKKGGGYKKLAARFKISLSSVRRWIRFNQIYQDISPRPHAGGIPPKITESQWPALMMLVAEKPDRTTAEISDEWNKRYGVNVHPSSMTRALIKAGLRFKKNTSSR